MIMIARTGRLGNVAFLRPLDRALVRERQRGHISEAMAYYSSPFARNGGLR
jgi:hypothetical protein